jgi:signal transduction histidine kinase/CheY-like chemotaxis protein/HPt (histidine-containing phosphotransfer) domain-containing protein
VREALDEIDVGVILLDSKFSSLFVNRAFFRLWRLPVQETLNGRDLEDLLRTTLEHRLEPMPPAELQAIVKERIAILRSGSTTTRDLRLADGQVIRAIGKPLPNGARMILYSDVTDLFQLADKLHEARDAAEAATRVKSEFLATMSHEIRTPMNGVMGMIGLLLETNLNAEQLKLARTARESADSLLKIIDDILDYSKLESGKIDLEAVNFSPEQLVDGVASLLTARAMAKGIGLSMNLSPGTPLWVRGDPTRLRQMLFNLVGNGIKFTEKGDVKIIGSYRDLGDGKLELRFEVRDTGIGIAEDARSRLFTRFSQADSSTTRRFGGTGLGLAICRQLAEAMGGQIGVDSQVGRGSNFFFTVRCELGEPPAGISRPDSASLDMRSLRILVAEDNSVNQLFIKTMLHRLGHRVDVVANGAEAVAAVKHVPYDVVLMDIQMPEMDGATATRIIRQLEGPIAQIPIIALTANVMADQRQEYLAAGMDDYVTKPIERPLLLAALAKVAAKGNDPSTKDASAALVNTTGGEQASCSALPVFDAGRLAALREVFGAEEFRLALSHIPDEAANCLSQMNAAVSAGDLDAVRKAAHSLKGMAGNFGATRLAAISRSIELESPAIDVVARTLRELEQIVEETCARIREIA